MSGPRYLLGVPLVEEKESEGISPGDRGSDVADSEFSAEMVRWIETMYSEKEADTAPDGVQLPPGESLAERFVNYWERWEYIRDLGRAICTRDRPIPPYSAYDVPLLIATFNSDQISTLERLQQIDISFEFAVNVAISEGETSISWGALNAPSYFADSSAAAMAIEAHEPDTDLLADLRLPASAANLILANPVFIPPHSRWWSEEERELAAAHGESTQDQLAELMQFDPNLTRQYIGDDPIDPVYAILENGARIVGATFFADENGFLLDTVSWMIDVDCAPNSGSISVRRTGSLSKSTLAPILYNLAAVVAWGDWEDPGEPDPRFPRDSTELDAARNKGWFRRAVRSHPSRFGVRTLNRHTRTPSPDGPEDATPSDRTVKAHLRRGHWRSVRIATRDENDRIIGDVHGDHGTDWHYEGRWVPPTIVNQHTAPDNQIAPAVYVIPEPDWYRDGGD